jgi:DNA gyrase subunit A
MALSEDFILSIAEDGVGKRTSAYEYRITKRGGQGIANLDLTRTGGKFTSVAGVFPVEASDQLVMVTDGGKLIRCPVEGIRIAGRSTRGVRVLDVAEDEKVVSVTRLSDDGTEEEDEANTDETLENAAESGESADVSPETPVENASSEDSIDPDDQVEDDPTDESDA